MRGETQKRETKQEGEERERREMREKKKKRDPAQGVNQCLECLERGYMVQRVWGVLTRMPYFDKVFSQLDGNTEQG